MSFAIFALLFAIFGGDYRPQSGGNEAFIAAKALYAKGEYEAALTQLTTANAPGGAAEVNQYRALCFLALGRTAEAERSLEELVTQQPLFKMNNVDVSPRVVTMFRDVRRRLLPAAVRDLYAKARTNYDTKEFAAAVTQFKELQALLADEDLGSEAKSLADLKILTGDFLRLSEIELVNAAKAEADAAAKAKAEADLEAKKKPEPPPVNRIYTEADKDVTPPVELTRELPEWRPPTPAAAMIGYRGVLRLVIDQQGKVETVSLVQKVVDSYDPLLIAAAKQWTFRPARKDGKPVRYQKVIGVTLLPSR